MSKTPIIYYTDCFIFGGCEKPVYEVITSGRFREKYDCKIFYRKSSEYCDGLCKTFPGIDKELMKGFRFPDQTTGSYFIRRLAGDGRLSRSLNFVHRVLLRLAQAFIFTYEVIVLAAAFALEKASVVHINNGGYPGALSCRAAAVAAKLAGKKHVVLSVHNTAADIHGLTEGLIDKLVRPCVDVVITGSKASLNVLAAKRGFDKNKMINIYHGIETSGEQRPEGNLSSGFPRGFACMIARFEERKGHIHVVSAWEKMLKENPENKGIKLVLIGAGPELRKIKGIVLEKGLSDDILFLGHRNDYKTYLMSSRFLLNPSLGFEDLPYVILEAMSLGIPAIGTNIAGIPEEIADGITGIVIPAGDEAALKDAIIKLLADEGTTRQMGQAAKTRYLEMFTIDKMIGNYISFYDKLIK